MTAIALRPCDVPELCVVQEAPPSVVLMIVPFAPTAQADKASAAPTPYRICDVFEFAVWSVKLAKLSGEVRIVPVTPTANDVPFFVATALSARGAPPGHCQLAPPLVVTATKGDVSPTTIAWLALVVAT